jgi:hypothetical protein
MSSIAAEHLGPILAAALAIGAPCPTLAAGADNEAAVVAKLYKDYAWQAVASQRDLFGEDLAHQSKAVLETYFAPALAGLLVKDGACQMREQGICNLDFDPLFDSQDPRVTDLEVARASPGTVSVVYKDPVDGKTTRIDFEVARVAGKWKITDVVYRRPEKTSLKQVLSRKIP